MASNSTISLNIDKNMGEDIELPATAASNCFQTVQTKISSSIENVSLSEVFSKSKKIEDEYDFIVVGAGSAGCAVASRLSENPDVSVLLVEAGNNHNSKEVRSPFIHCPDLQNSKRDWRFRTVPQPGTLNHVSHWPRGKTLGGSSSINYMLYVRGDPRTYDHWAHDLGCEGWSYNDVLPYFKKSENYLGVKGEQKYHGKGGPLTVTNMADDHEVFQTKEITERFVQACVEQGLPENPDFNGAFQTGAGLSQITVKDAVRQDTATSFLFKTGAIDRPNLTVITDAMVTKIMIQGDKATGICLKCGNEELAGLDDSPKDAREKISNTSTLVVHARKEVVLSAGAVCTPWLLMLSGIGPAEHLESKGIPVVKDLPVGQNMQDHMFIIDVRPLKDQTGEKGFSTRNPWHLAKNLFGHYFGGNGVFNYPWVKSMAFLRSKLQAKHLGNDLQIHFVPFIFDDQRVYGANFGGTIERDGPISDLSQNASYGVTFLPTLLLPKSTGTISLNSSDPLDYPVIDPQYYSHPDDIKIALEAVKFVDRMAESSAFKDFLDAPRVDPWNPHPVGSDEYKMYAIRKASVTVYHPTSTARMGPPEEPNAVCDLRLRVRGIRGLRIADTSVLPTVTSGNTNAPAIMVGERAADFIKEDWGFNEPE